MFEKLDLRKLKYSLIPMAALVLITLIQSWVLPIGIDYPRDRTLGFIIATAVFEHLVRAVIILWECVYYKKYRSMWVVALLLIPSLLSSVLFILFKDGELSGLPNNLLFVVNMLLSPLALYGLLRRKILYKESLSWWGYLVGFAAIYVQLNALSSLLHGVLGYYIYRILFSWFGNFLFFYLLGLCDSGFTLKTVLRPVANSSMLPKKLFYFHFLLLFISLFMVLYQLFGYEHIFPGYFLLFGYVQCIVASYLLYFVFSRLLLERHQQLRLPVSWSYLLSFIPLVNLYPMLRTYSGKPRERVAQRVLMRNELLPHKVVMQKWLSIIAGVCIILPVFFPRYSGHVGEYLAFVIPMLIAYIIMLSWRGGVWIFIGLRLVAYTIFVLMGYEDVPRLTIMLFVQALFAYNIHRTMFADIVDEPLAEVQ